MLFVRGLLRSVGVSTICTTDAGQHIAISCSKDHAVIAAAVQLILVLIYLALHSHHGPCLDPLSVLVVQVTMAPAQALDANPANVSSS